MYKTHNFAWCILQVEGLMMDDVTAVKEENKGWKMASEEDAEARKSIEQEFLTHVRL